MAIDVRQFSLLRHRRCALLNRRVSGPVQSSLWCASFHRSHCLQRNQITEKEKPWQKLLRITVDDFLESGD